MCPSTNLLMPSTFKKKHGLSNIMMPSSSNVNQITLQSITKPVSTPSTDCKSLNSSNTRGSFDKNSLSLSLSITKTQVSCTVPKTDITEGNKDLSAPTITNTSSPASTGTVKPQIVIGHPISPPGGAHIALNNAHFMVPPQGLCSGSHIFVISDDAPQQLPTTSAKEAIVPFQEVKQPPVLVQSATKLSCVSAFGSYFGACTTAVAPLLQATSSFVTSAQLTGPNKTITKTVLPQVPTELTIAPTVVNSPSSKCWTVTTTSLPFYLSSASPPSSVSHSPSTVLGTSFIAAPSCSQVVPSLTLSTQASTRRPSQYPTNSIASVSCYLSSATVGHSRLMVVKQEPTVKHQVLDSHRTVQDEPAISSKNNAHETTPQSLKI